MLSFVGPAKESFFAIADGKSIVPTFQRWKHAIDQSLNRVLDVLLIPQYTYTVNRRVVDIIRLGELFENIPLELHDGTIIGRKPWSERRDNDSAMDLTYCEQAWFVSIPYIKPYCFSIGNDCGR